MLSAQTAKLVSIYFNFSAKRMEKSSPPPFFAPFSSTSLASVLPRFPYTTVYPRPPVGQIEIFRGIPAEVSSIRRSRCHEANNVNFNLLPPRFFLKRIAQALHSSIIFISFISAGDGCIFKSISFCRGWIEFWFCTVHIWKLEYVKCV